MEKVGSIKYVGYNKRPDEKENIELEAIYNEIIIVDTIS